MVDAKKRHDKAPVGNEYEYEFGVKTDIVYRLIMPELDELLRAEFSQSGDENGFELFRQSVARSTHRVSTSSST